jgi:hypothetical protein
MKFTSSVIVLWLLSVPSLAQSPIKDIEYLQESGTRTLTKDPITALGILDEKLYAVMNGSLFLYENQNFVDVTGGPNTIRRLKSLQGKIWVTTIDSVWTFDGALWSYVYGQPMVDFTLHLGHVHGATRDDIFRFEKGEITSIKPKSGYLSSDITVIMADGSQVLANPVRISPIQRIASYNETLYILQPNRLAFLDGPVFNTAPLDWGAFPSRTLRDMKSHGSRLLITTDRGVATLRGMALTTENGSTGLPYEDTTCLTSGLDGELWIGTTTGAIRHSGKSYQYYGVGNWLPGGQVHDIAVSDSKVYVATSAGLATIEYIPFTLQDKAAYFEEVINKGGFKRLGFLHKLWKGGDGWTREISDNDGGHTAHYLAAMCFKYAVTNDPKAREEAVNSFKAMVWLDDITPKVGFIARSIHSVHGDAGQLATQGSGGLPAKWYETEDKNWYWKGDTSSDEVNAHFYSVALFHDLVAQGTEKDRAKKHLANIATHIIDNGWVLRDMDGQPTRWGQWSPEYLLTPYGIDAKGLNGMEAQTYMIVAHTLTGDPKFKAGLEQLMEWRYHTYTARQKVTFPPDAVVPWDDELAFRCYEPLLRYTEDPYLRSIYLRSIQRHWEVMRMQKVPYFNFIYGHATGNDCEASEAVQHLREWNLDSMGYSYQNSHRSDLDIEPGYTPYMGGTKGLSPRDMVSTWGSRSAIRYDGGNGGRGITPPVGWLEDYWMGRYYGFISAADSSTNPTISFKETYAVPYTGTPRPEIKL